MASEHLDSNRSTDALDEVVLPLCADHEPLGWEGHLLLAVGLCVKTEALGVVSTDLLIAAAADGRLDPALLGSHLAALVDGGGARCARAAERMSTAARCNGLVADAMRQAAIAWLERLTTEPPDVHATLAALQLACAESGGSVRSASARAALERMAQGSTKRSRLARSLLALDGENAAAMGLLMLARLVEHAETAARDHRREVGSD